MEYILTTTGTSGDIYPFIGLAKELLRRGHKVHLLTSSAYKNAIEQHGINFFSILSEKQHLAALNDNRINRASRNISGFSDHFILPAMEPAYHFIKQHYKPNETVLVSHAMFLGGKIAQEKIGIPLISIHLAPIGLRSIERPSRHPVFPLPHILPYWLKKQAILLSDNIVDRLFNLSRINQFRKSIGLAPIKHIFRNWIYEADKLVGLFPSWYGGLPSDWQYDMQLTTFPLFNPILSNEIPRNLKDFCKKAKTIVIFTAGSGMPFANRFFEEAIKACKLLNCHGILLSRYRQQIPATIPDNIFHLDYLSMQSLLSMATAIVHFGGIGTASQALAQGVPQLIVPNIGDQFDNALRLRQTGTAMELSQSRFKAKIVAKQLEQLLSSPRIKSYCQKYAALLSKENPLGKSCDAIESLTIQQEQEATLAQ